MSSTILLKGLDNKYMILKHTSCWWTDQSFKQPKRDSRMACPSSEFIRYLVISAAWQEIVHQNLSIKTGSVHGGFSFYQRSCWLPVKLNKSWQKPMIMAGLCSISRMYPHLWYQGYVPTLKQDTAWRCTDLSLKQYWYVGSTSWLDRLNLFHPI